jgi:putative membrane-bound dehydrogenase-like protein
MRITLLFALAVLWVQLVNAQTGLPPGVVNTQNPKDKPLTPLEALAKMTLPDGFKATLFAGEPDVLQPIAFDFDDRGRLWGVECFSYPDFKVQERDRILIFTDKDGDGKFDERKVFLDNGRRLSGITIGFGGVWVTSAPELLFYPDRNGDDVPDGKPEVLLDGWTLKAGHNMVNGLAWGPDGWLYGRHGITTFSMVGKPGMPESERIKLSCSIWRYHTIRKTFEVVVNGTTNPWGLDWDDYGQPFFSNNVIGHLWHVIAGAHYKRMFGEDFNPYVYALMDQTADHLHWVSSDWTKSRTGQGAMGGGHSHSGAMIYLGDNWPAAFRSRIMMANIHGNRLLYDELVRKDSGYVGHHGSDFLMANDAWFRGIQIGYGPDGGVFVSDWNDFGECHDTDGAYRMSGRLYKITYGAGTKPVGNLDLQRMADAELVKLQLHTNDWFVRHARRVLQERAAAGKLARDTHGALTKIVRENPDVTRKLRALWVLHVTGALVPQMNVPEDPRYQKRLLDSRGIRPPAPVPSPLLMELTAHKDENLRWWAVHLLAEDKTPMAQALQRFAAMAREEQSPFVRMALASALQRVPMNSRLAIAEGLLSRAEDANDPNLPLMIWYGIEPAVPLYKPQALRLAGQSRIPLVREFIARRVAAP